MLNKASVESETTLGKIRKNVLTVDVMIKEVAARDGLQAQSKHLTLEQRRTLICSLSKTGVRELEVGSFVSSRAVPQMADTDVLARQLPKTPIEYSALVPNMKGYERAIASGIRTQAIAISATEQMNQANIQKGLEETFLMAEKILTRAHNEGVAIHAYLAVAFECPYEGYTDPRTVLEQAQRLIDAKPARLVIADAIGAANPGQVANLMGELVSQHDSETLGCHFHDTRALAIANVYAALVAGIRRFDSAAGGLGGCPFTPGAKGNVATEDVVLLCGSMGLSTGIDLRQILISVELLSQLFESPQGGRSHSWLSKHLAFL